MKKILAFALALAMILTCSLALADRLDDIKAAGKLTVATSPDWPPYEYIDDDGNHVPYNPYTGEPSQYDDTDPFRKH